mmetsp:Transcript_87353/g.203181  ORF Transcript_87353/g.203181 Transcript_87353/m.203181 type:complete len:501 (+) Transcript_87353:34-1536(+)
MSDGSEFLALRTAFGKQIASKPWPLEGDNVLIRDSWDGPAVHGSSAFLSVSAGDRVLVTHRNRDGLLYGSVEVDLGQPERAGWFGGKGCVASLELTLPVPLGPTRPLTEVPWGPPGTEGSNGDADAAADPEVEAYIHRHGIDTSAAQALRELEPELQAQVIQSDLTNCRNPSAVLLCRIDRVRSAAAPPPPPPMVITARGHAPRSRSPPRRQALPAPPAHSAEPASPEAVEEFIIHHGLDEKAAQALRDVPPDLQTSIIEIELSNCRNPSAVVVSRIQSLNATANYVESYIQEFGLDDKCAAELRSISPLEQQQVIEARPTNARNPSAVVISRIQAVRSQGQQLQLVEDYIMRHGIDDSVANALRNLSHEGQRQIINSDLSNCRNPSAVLLSRIRAVETQVAARSAVMLPARPPPPPMTPRPPLLPAVQYRSQTPSALVGGSGESPEAFIQRHNLDQEAAQAMRALPPELQRQVMERGELINCRNPSKVLISRIRQLGAA